MIPRSLGYGLFTVREDQRLSICERGPRYQRETVRSFALKQKSPSFHRADLDAPAAQLNPVSVLIGSTGRGAETRQGKME